MARLLRSMELYSAMHVFLRCSIFIAFIFPKAWTKITIDIDGKLITWEGCIFRRTNIPEDKNDSCYKCTENSSMPVIPLSLDVWPQPYFNCTDFCYHRTICTKEKYYNGIDPYPKSLCYDCENRKNEEVIFEFVRDDDLCSPTCSSCASVRDLAQATICAKDCQGRPTFCFPIQHWFGRSIKCYKATYWYGCDFIPVVNVGNLSLECKACALAATDRMEAQECAFTCGGWPMYHIHHSDDKIGDNKKATILKCRPHIIDADKNGMGSYYMEDLFLYDLPNILLPFMRFNIPNSLYPAEYLSKSFLAGPIAKNIWKKFNMATMTFPKPKAFRTL